MHTIPRYWAGTPESLQAFIEGVARALDAGPRADYIDPSEDPQDCPDLYERQGEIGVVSIKGSLTNSDSWMNAFIGAVSYGQIREALIYAANDAGVKAIALDISSGGGAVSGMSDTADLIATIDQKIKPVYAFTDSLMASAAYSLGVSARQITIGKMAESGSIGVLLVHREVSKMMEMEGVTTTVIRSGKWKALGNSSEPLSDLAKETLQAQVDKLNGLFVEHVAACRKKPMAQVESQMGGGRVFIGSDAVDVGLVDALDNFDGFMSSIAGGIDKLRAPPQYGGNSNKNLKGHTLKTALTEQQIAAIAAGAAPTPAASTAPETLPTADAPAQPDAPAAATTPTASANQEVVSLLQGQLATAQAQILSLSVESQATKAAHTALEATAGKLRPIVRAAVGNLRVALGGSASGIESLTDDNLMAEHASLSAQFGKQFPAGGVAAVSSTATAEKSESVDPFRRARLAATRLA
jgi:signal peptide peptidase SppA